jgi:hypothetical protein
MTKWQHIEVRILQSYTITVRPGGLADYSRLAPAPNKIMAHGELGFDQLQYKRGRGIDIEKAVDNLIDLLGEDGWEPFTVLKGEVLSEPIWYLKRGAD